MLDPSGKSGKKLTRAAFSYILRTTFGEAPEGAMATSGTRAAGKDLVLIGGGHSHVFVLKRFGLARPDGVRLTLISPTSDALYSGMLPGLVAGHYTIEETHIDLERLAHFSGARFIRDEAVGLDLARRHVLCRDRLPQSFDVLSIDIGSAPRTDDVPGAAEAAVPIKPIGRFLDRWTILRDRVMTRAEPTRIGIVGAGAGGVEILLAAQLALQHRLAAAGRGEDAPEFHLFSDASDILPGHNTQVRAIFRSVLAERGIRFHLGRAVIAAAPGHVTTADGTDHPIDEIVWATAAGAAPWLQQSGLRLDVNGFIAVDAALRSVSDDGVFAAGDIASSASHPRPKAGVFAVRQGPVLAENLRRALLGRDPRPFVPQRQFLSLISTGDKSAVASRGSWAAGGEGVLGRALWQLKDRIDRRFVAAFNELPKSP
jgi:selenide,water dikinase